MKRSEYAEKMKVILEDTENFTKLNEDLITTIRRYEDKNNRLVDSLGKKDMIDETTCKKLKACGSRPSIMYEKPKVHKPNVPLRPILPTCGSFNYNMSKWLVPKLVSLCTN